MLNILLSFAQFEREITDERIRDKIAASKAKGMWMDELVLLGYELHERKLVINPGEAMLVRRVFADFVRRRSPTDLLRQLAAEGNTSRSGRPISKQALYKMFHNRPYLGEILHKGQAYPGQHEAIITRETWDAAHAILAESSRHRAAETRLRRTR